jgi:hypothetical protein
MLYAASLGHLIDLLHVSESRPRPQTTRKRDMIQFNNKSAQSVWESRNAASAVKK